MTDVAKGMSPPPQSAPKLFDLGTINFGHLLTIAVILVGLVGSYYVSGFRLEMLEKQVAAVNVKLDGMTAVLIEAAVTKQRLHEFERRLAIAEQRR